METAPYGSSEHAALMTAHRSSRVHDALQWLTYAHLPAELQRFSSIFYSTGVELVSLIGGDAPELIIALDKLTEAKDAAMRAGIRSRTGRAGSVPRPQEVIHPPSFDWTVEQPHERPPT